MLYSQDIIEEIRVQNDIIEVISDYIPLKQKGNSYFGLCPFHHEVTPSFSVSPDKQFYYCFGCGAAGNVYSFLMKMDNCDFPEAIKILAQRANIQLPEAQYSQEEKELENLKKRLYEIHKEAGRFYYSKLHSKEGERALNYIVERGVLPNIQRKFGIGYSPKDWDSLFKYLLNKGFTTNELLKSGLISESKTKAGVYNDKFINRIMFPIIDLKGQIVAFGGRILQKGEPKYLNSPETIIFHKSRTMFGLNFAKAAKKREIIIVEGYMDMISIYQAGFHNVAASLGTSFNSEHAKTLKKLVDSVILLYDSDEAGTNAALRAIPVLVSNGFNVKVLQVPDGKDPDEFIKQNGARKFGELLFNAVSYITFQINILRKGYNLNNLEHKIKFTTEVSKLLSKLESDIERDVYILQISKETGIEEKSIKNEILKLKEIEEFKFAKEAEQKRKKIYTSLNSTKENNQKGIIEAQKYILYICSTSNSLYKKIKDYINIDEYIMEVYRKIAKIIYNFNDIGHKIFPAEIINYFELAEEQQTAAEIFALKFDYKDIKEKEKLINEGIKLIKRTKIDELMSKSKDINDIQNLIQARKKLDVLYINISDG